MDYASMIADIVKDDKEGKAAVRESLDRQKKYKLRHNDLLEQYKALLAQNNIDDTRMRDIIKRLNMGLNLIGKAHADEVENGFLLTEMQGIVLDMTNVAAARTKIEETIEGDFWELKKIDCHRKLRRIVAVFERPYYWRFANVIEE